MVEENTAIHLKHSTKRMSPWQFTFMSSHFGEIEDLKGRFDSVWVALICGVDGFVTLSSSELDQLIGTTPTVASFVRVERGRRKMYRVSGSLGHLDFAKANGLGEMPLRWGGSLVEEQVSDEQ
jgi:hypothetical protein